MEGISPMTLFGRTFLFPLIDFLHPSDWQDERPPAPSFLRILYLGKILQDDDTLARMSYFYVPLVPA
jgi:hypothetical protein